jgi:hypothetical protein
LAEIHEVAATQVRQRLVAKEFDIPHEDEK